MSDDADWKRPHPLTTIVLVVTFVSGNAGPLVVAVVFGGSGIGFDTVALVVGGATVGFGVVGWYMTGYAVTDDAVHYRSGVLNRQARSIALTRIQQVSVSEPVIARAVGLAVVQVSEASADGDVEIRYLGKNDATALTQRLRTLARRRDALDNQGPVVSSLAAPPEPPSVLLHATPIGALVRYSLGAMAPGLIGAAVIGLVVVIVLALGPGLVAALSAAVVVAGILLLAPALSTAGAVLGDGGFRLQRSPRSLTAQAGLLSRRQIEVRPERIQTLTVSSGPIVRRMGLHQISFSAATGKTTQKTAIVRLSPAARTDEIASIVRGALDVDPAFGVDLEPVSRVTVRRQLVRSAIAYALVVLPISIVLWFVHPFAAVLPTLAFWPPAFAYARQRHRRLGLAVDDRRLVARSGVLDHHLTQIPLAHIQSVITRATFFQRRLGVADLEVNTAGVGPGNHVTIPDLGAGRCAELARDLSSVAAATRWELRT
ncbi:MAG: PH domain-containing protein [Acidimicrobiales bacterium]